MRSRLLINLAGKDRPGITASVLNVLARGSAQILDIEQSVIHDQLSLTFLAQLPVREQRGVFDSLLVPLHQTADKFGLAIRIVPFRPSRHIRRSRRNTYAITVLGDVIAAHDLEVITTKMRDLSLNIEKIHTLTEQGFNSLEFIVHDSSGRHDERAIKHQLLPAISGLSIDLAVQRETLFRRNKRLLVMDVDSTLVQGEIIDELARRAGVEDRVSAITERAMAGELDFPSALRERVKLLKGLTERDLEEVAGDMQLNPGAETLIRSLKYLGYKIAIISGGFDFFTERLKDQLGLDYAYANRLQIKEGRLTGKLVGSIVDADRKAATVVQLTRELNIGRDQVVAVGDGANDLKMLESAGLGIGFHPKPVVRKQAAVSVTAGGLNRILYLLGIEDAAFTNLP